MARHVFIGGLHRAGTSLLHDLLGSYPGVSRFRDTGVPKDEGQHLQGVVPTARALGGPGRFGHAAALDGSRARPEQAQALLEAWRPHWDPEAPIWLEKSPVNTVRTRFLQALFPGAAFVLLVRHPVVVALSTRRWTAQPLREVLAHTLFCQERMLGDAAHLETAIPVRYEDLCRDPDVALRPIEIALGLGVRDQAVPVETGRNAAYLAELESTASRSERDAIEDHARRIAALGYSPFVAEPLR